jgi:hypothetical protein
VGKEEASVLTKNNIPVQARKIFPAVSPIYGVYPSIGWHCGADVVSEEKKWENKTCESVKWLKGENLEDVLVIWIGQDNAKNETANDEVIEEQVKVLGQQISVTNVIHKNWYVFFSKNEIISKYEYCIR